MNPTDTSHPKIPNTNQPISSFVLNRWSVRSFSDQMISPAILDHLFEAASWAPSSMNEQPWVYLYGWRGDALFETIWNCLLPGNQPWTKKASVLMLSLAKKNHASLVKPNKYHLYDVGAANQTLLLEAASLGILGHQMGGFDIPKILDALNIPNTLEPSVCLALGYPDTADKLEEPFYTREISARTRKATEMFAFQGKLPETDF